MITLLDRQVFRRALITFVLLCSTLVVLFLSIDLLVRFNIVAKAQLPAGESRAHLLVIRCLTHVPYLLKSFLPFVMIGTVIITVLPMLRHRQLMLLAASGIGGRRVCASLLFLAVVVGITDAVNRDFILPVTEPMRDDIENILIGMHGSTCSWKMPDTNTVWFAKRASRSQDDMELTTVVAFADDGAMLFSRQVTLHDGQWRADPPIRLIDVENNLLQLHRLPDDPVFALPASAEELEALTTPRRFWFGPRLLAHGQPEDRAIVYSRWMFLLASPLAVMLSILVLARPGNRDQLTKACTRTLMLGALPVFLCSMAEEVLMLLDGPPEIWAMSMLFVLAGPIIFCYWRLRV